MDIIFMGTPEFALPTLKALNESKQHNIKAVFTAYPKSKGRGMKLTPSPVGEFAACFNLPVYTPKTLRSEEVQKQIHDIEADLIVVVAYGFIIPKSILYAKKYGCLNIHPSMLPKYRGAAPLQRVIITGEKETAVCIIQMDEGLDTGDILMSTRFSLEEDITLIDLHDKCAKIGADILLKTLQSINNLSPISQDSLIKDGKCLIDGRELDDKVIYAKKLTKEEAEISWNEDAFVIDCKVRGSNPWPGIHFNLKNTRYLDSNSNKRFDEASTLKFRLFKEEKIIKIIKSKIIGELNYNLAKRCRPGDIISDEFDILCGDGKIIKLLEVKPSGKYLMSGEEFLRGMNFNNK